MKIRKVISTILGLVLVLGQLTAQEQVREPEAPQASAATTGHPLFEGGFYPSWSKMTPETIKADLAEAIQRARTRYEAICNIQPGEETYENVFQAMEYADYELDFVIHFANHLFQVANTQEMRREQEAVLSTIAAFALEVPANQRLWQVVKRAAAQPWVKELPPAKQRFVQEVVDMFQESGADLPPEKQALMQEKLGEMVKLQLVFDRNIERSAMAWNLTIKDRKQLEGMPRAWMVKRSSGGIMNHQWNLWLSDAMEVLRFCDVEETRKACWEGLQTYGHHPVADNGPVVARIMELRQELAELAGAANFADMVNKHHMVHTGQNAIAFVDDMMQRLLPAFQRENQELLDFVSECKGEKVEKINPWDYRYYTERLSRKHGHFDDSLLTPYLCCDNVLKGMMGIASRLYDISFTELPTVYIDSDATCPEGSVEVWDPSVKVYKVTDNKTGAHLGSFYLDIFQHYGKQGGAWTHLQHAGLPGKNGQPHEPHLVALVANFSPSHVKAGKILLTQDNVVTLFHEFGHVMHAILGDTDPRFFCLHNVKPDFAELPSQLNENWAWEPEAIATYAFHYETGEPAPAELVQQLVSSRYYRPATKLMEMLRRSKLDLELHAHYAEKFAGKPLDDASNELLAPWLPPFTQGEASEIHFFPHCVSRGYCAAYFSYPWADVMAADAFSRFKKEGVFNPGTGDSYRRTILEQGDSKPAEELYRDFMGHDPDPDALQEKQGLK